MNVAKLTLHRNVTCLHGQTTQIRSVMSPGTHLTSRIQFVHSEVDLVSSLNYVWMQLKKRKKKGVGGYKTEQTYKLLTRFSDFLLFETHPSKSGVHKVLLWSCCGTLSAGSHTQC